MKNRIIAAAGAFVLAASALLTGCGSTDGNQPAITVGDNSISLGAASFLLRYSQAATTNMMTAYGYGTTGIWDTAYTNSSSEEVTYGQEFKDSVRDNIAVDILMKAHSDEYNVTIPEDLQTSIDDTAKKVYEKNKDSMDENGISEENIKEAIEFETYTRLMYNPMIADTDRNVSDDEAAMSTLTYARIDFVTSDDQGNQVNLTDDQKQEKWDNLEKLIEKVKEDSDPAGCDMKALAEEIDPDLVVGDTSYNDDSTLLPDKIYETARSLEDGRIYDKVIDTGDYYYVVRQNKKFDEDATETQKQTIISTRESDNYNKKLDAWKKESETKTEKCWDKLEVSDKDLYTTVTATSSGAADSSDGSAASSAEEVTSAS
ncbi:MAG: hypothetical protein U0L49_00740 [Eubacterium sp.]|nr:hypothetical protein [Eubacterium sp.]